MDELQPEKQIFDSKKSPLILMNLVITCLAMGPVCGLNEMFYDVLLNNKEEYHNQSDFIFVGIVYGLPIIIWIVSMIFSIQGLLQKKLGKLKTIYLILSFILILFASLYSLWIFISIFPD